LKALSRALAYSEGALMKRSYCSVALL